MSMRSITPVIRSSGNRGQTETSAYVWLDYAMIRDNSPQWRLQGPKPAPDWKRSSPCGTARPGRLVILACVLLAAPLAADAPPAEHIRRIGWLLPNAPPPPVREALLQGLRPLGFVEGQNLVIELRHGQGTAESLPALAA